MPAGASGGASRVEPYPEESLRRLSIEGRVDAGAAVYLGLPIHDEPRWILACRIPASALDESSAHLRGEYAWIIGSTSILAAMLALAAAFVVRISVREIRLREHSHYLDRIRRESAKYRALMDGAADMILIVDPASGEVRESNAIAREVLSLSGSASASSDASPSPSPAPARTLDAILAGAGRDSVGRAIDAALAGERVSLAEIRARSRDGSALHVDARLAAIDLEDERVIEVSLRDLSAQRELERRLRISERMGSLGLLTAGVAHEINNPLEGIGNYLALLDRETLAPEKRKSYLALVRHGFGRVRDIVRDLSSFVRSRDTSGVADLAEVLRHALAMVRYSQRLRRVEVELVGLERPIRVSGETGRLEQVFINLLLNAATATQVRGQGRGHIRVTARSPAGDSGSWVEVLVEDDGPGIPEADIAQIFDPFFTRARAEGAGSLGLGLFISYGIVDAHGGTLWAENRREGGARFVVRLPLDERTEPDGEAGERQVAKRSESTQDEPEAHDSRRR